MVKYLPMMPETFNPDYLKTEATAPAKKRAADLAYSLAIIILSLLLLAIGYLLYFKYFKPGYQLTAWLPKNYNLAIALNSQPESLFKISSQEILANPLINKAYKKITDDLNVATENLSNDAQSILKKTKRAVIFFPDEKNFGAIIELADQADGQKLESMDFGDWPRQLVLKKILLLASNADLLDSMTEKNGSKNGSFSDLTLEIKPLLTLYLEKSFFNQPYLNAWLIDLQMALSPLAKKSQENFIIKFSSQPKNRLVIDLQPTEQSSTGSATSLESYLKLLPKENDLIFGLTDLNDLAGQLAASQALRDYFKAADSWLWQNWQLSLSQLLKNLAAPLLIARQENDWQLIGPVANQSQLDWMMRQYLAQFSPIKKPKVLPDGTKAVELIADAKTVKWQNRQAEDWQIFEFNHPQKPNKIGYAVKNDLMIVSNNLENIAVLKQKNTKMFDIKCDLANISTILSINPQKQGFLISSTLQNFANITAISSNSGEIKMCLELK